MRPEAVGLLPRFALTCWPSLRADVTDVVAAAGTQHGSRGCPRTSARTPYAPGLDEAVTSAILGASGNLITSRLVSQVPRVPAEPPLRAYARRPAD